MCNYFTKNLLYTLHEVFIKQRKKYLIYMYKLGNFSGKTVCRVLVIKKIIICHIEHSPNVPHYKEEDNKIRV